MREEGHPQDGAGRFPHGETLPPDGRAPGFDDEVRARAAAALAPGQRLARVTAVDRGAYLVRDKQGETHAELAGRFRFAAASTADFPCVGDWVCVEPTSPSLAILHAVLPRKTLLRRKRPGKAVDHQMIAANLDVAFIVQAFPGDVNARRLDRYGAVVREGGIEPALILNKTDLVAPEAVDAVLGRLRDAGRAFPVFPLSLVTGRGWENFREFLRPGRTYGLLGSSGVGKTTLINRLLGGDALPTRAVSGTGEGVHTTARRQLFALDNGALLIDTPGMRELGLLGARDGVEAVFPDIHELSASCRFADCTHTREPGCAVRAALASGDLGEEAYRSYLKLRRETEFHDLSYAQKRQKDRVFGRFIKSALKQGKR